MIHLIASRIRHAEYAAHFLKLPKDTWRFIVQGRDVHHFSNSEMGDLFVRVIAPRQPNIANDDIERMAEIDALIAHYHIQTLEYRLP